MPNGGTNLVQETSVAPSATVNTNGASVAARNSSKPAKKVNKTSEMLETISANTVNTKLDDVLKTVRQLDNTCDFGRCRTKTSLIGQDCTLCQQRFCMKHQLPGNSSTVLFFGHFFIRNKSCDIDFTKSF